MIIIKNKKLLLSLSVFLVAFLFSSCALLNIEPVIESDPITTTQEGALYTYTVEATDPEGDTLTFSLSTSPDGMTINSSTGEINWTSTEEQIGANEVTVEVSDQFKSTTQTFTITVGEATLTSITVLPTVMTLTKGQSKPITSVTASYSNGAVTDIALTTCEYESNRDDVTVSSSGIIKASESCQATTANVTVSYTDGVTREASIIVTIKASG